MVSEWIGVVAGRDEAVDDSNSVACDRAKQTVRGGDQPTRLTQRWRLGIGPQVVAEGGMLGQQGRGADAQCSFEEGQRGELRRGGKQAMVEGRWVRIGGRHRSTLPRG